MNPDLSYVIPVYNKKSETVEFLQKCLASIRTFTKKHSYEIILIDNRSPEHEIYKTDELRESVYGDAKVISLPQNIGFGAACNLGFRLSSGKYLVCMNSDAELVEDTPAILESAMSKYNLQVIMPEHYDACVQAGVNKDDVVMGEWFFGAFWMSTRDFIVNKMYGFDEAYKMCYYEDTDLWSRIFASGFQVRGYRGTWVKHKGNASALPTFHELFQKNHDLYVSRWGTEKVVTPDVRRFLDRTRQNLAFSVQSQK